MKKLFALLFVFLFGCVGQQSADNNNPARIESVKSPTAFSSPLVNSTPPNSLSAQKTEIKPLINFYNLANKSIAEIEKIYGTPSEIDTKSVQFKPGEFRIYDKAGKGSLQIDYSDGKAVGFYLDIPKTFQTQSPEETIKLCGLIVRLSEAETEQNGFWWKISTPPFYSVRLIKFSDSGLFYNCEAHIKI